jgi:hypothetical protein
MDVSGDGRNNTEVPGALARDQTVEEGIVINGLPIVPHENTPPTEPARPTSIPVIATA